MRLELHRAEVRDLRWGTPTRLENHVLYVDKEEAVAAISDDDRLESWEIDLARPGESVRIIPVKDVIEPRVKLEGGSGFFPGVLGPNETAGDGKTLVLSGAAVVSAPSRHSESDARFAVARPVPPPPSTSPPSPQPHFPPHPPQRKVPPPPSPTRTVPPPRTIRPTPAPSPRTVPPSPH